MKISFIVRFSSRPNPQENRVIVRTQFSEWANIRLPFDSGKQNEKWKRQKTRKIIQFSKRTQFFFLLQQDPIRIFLLCPNLCRTDVMFFELWQFNDAEFIFGKWKIFNIKTKKIKWKQENVIDRIRAPISVCVCACGRVKRENKWTKTKSRTKEDSAEQVSRGKEWRTKTKRKNSVAFVRVIFSVTLIKKLGNHLVLCILFVFFSFFHYFFCCFLIIAHSSRWSLVCFVWFTWNNVRRRTRTAEKRQREKSEIDKALRLVRFEHN